VRPGRLRPAAEASPPCLTAALSLVKQVRSADRKRHGSRPSLLRHESTARVTHAVTALRSAAIA
jgi:hypothetical protein